MEKVHVSPTKSSECDGSAVDLLLKLSRMKIPVEILKSEVKSSEFLQRENLNSESTEKCVDSLETEAPELLVSSDDSAMDLLLKLTRMTNPVESLKSEAKPSEILQRENFNSKSTEKCVDTEAPELLVSSDDAAMDLLLKLTQMTNPFESLKSEAKSSEILQRENFNSKSTEKCVDSLETEAPELLVSSDDSAMDLLLKLSRMTNPIESLKTQAKSSEILQKENLNSKSTEKCVDTEAPELLVSSDDSAMDLLLKLSRMTNPIESLKTQAKSSEILQKENLNSKSTEKCVDSLETEAPELLESSDDSAMDLLLKLSRMTNPIESLKTQAKSSEILQKENLNSKSTEKCVDSLETEAPEFLVSSDDAAMDLLLKLSRMTNPVESLKSQAKSSEILKRENLNSKSTEKCLDSLDTEAQELIESDKKENSLLTSVEVSDDVPEKVKKTVRMPSPENNSDGMSCKIAGLKPSPSFNHLVTLDPSISPGSKSNVSQMNVESGSMMDEAWERLMKSFVYIRGKPVGTLAALDPSADDLNYNQVFVRDFFPSGLACLMKDPPEPEIVKNFLLKTLHLQGWEKRIDNFTLGEGVMPASFKVLYDPHRRKDTLVADFGGSAIGRVAPVDSGFWWIILLRSYTKCTRDHTLSELPEVQKGMKLILDLCLSDGFDTFPTLLCADGCSMIDRRMGIYGYPIEIQALFFFSLRCAQQMLKPEHGGKELIKRIDKRITALSFHIQNYYWLDFTQLNNIYRYKTEEYSHTAVNKFNVIPESIPDWVFDFMTKSGGYLIGNVSPARMDFRWFLLGNCIAILSSLATPAQATAIMDLVEERWEDLIGEMPLKIVYPALEGHQWRIVTGCDPKNTQWSYHNGGSWPVLLWLLTAASIKTGRPQIAKRAIGLVEQRLSKDGWPEYYDGKTGRYIGKQARKYQTWSIAGYLVAKMMIENPSNLVMISLEEDKKMAKPKLTRCASL